MLPGCCFEFCHPKSCITIYFPCAGQHWTFWMTSWQMFFVFFHKWSNYAWSWCKSSSDSQNNSAVSVNGILVSLNEMINCPVPQLLVCGHVRSLQGSVCWWGRAAATCHGPAYPAAVISENVRPVRDQIHGLDRWRGLSHDLSDTSVIRIIIAGSHTHIWCCTVISWAPRIGDARGSVIASTTGGICMFVCRLFIITNLENWNWMTRGDGGKSSLFSSLLCSCEGKGFIGRKMRSIN